MKFRCPFCFYTVTAEESRRGYPVRCPSCGKEELVPPGRFEEGCILGDFLIKRKVGEGAIGSVYLAQQLSLDRQVALKILSPVHFNRKGAEDLLREARATAGLSHPNLVQSLAVGMEDNIYYLAMTYVNGETLSARLERDGFLPVDEALHIVQQTAEALHYVWQEKRIVHRDVKPENIMISSDGIVKLTDLGLAVNLPDWRGDDMISGSPPYMAPEIFDGGKPDTTSDIYSLGIMLYKMLCGHLPFEAASVKALALLHRESEAFPIEKAVPNLPPDVAKLVRKMMAKKPGSRFRNMEELLRTIWTIRQQTAPDSELVPDVHTVSLRRLDYGIQRGASKAQNRVVSLKHEISRSRLRQFVLILLIPVLIVLAVTATLHWYGHQPVPQTIENEMIRRIAQFQRFAQDELIPLEVIREEGENLKATFGRPRNRTQQLLMEQISAIVEHARVRRLEVENRDLLRSLRESKEESFRLQQQLRKQQTGKKQKGF